MASSLPFKGLGSAGGGQMLWGASVNLPGFCTLVPGHPSPGLLLLTSLGPQTLTGLTGPLGGLQTCSTCGFATAGATSGSPWPSQAPYPLDPFRHLSAGSAGPGRWVPRGGSYHTLGPCLSPGPLPGQSCPHQGHPYMNGEGLGAWQAAHPSWGLCQASGEAQCLSPSPGSRGPQQ